MTATSAPATVPMVLGITSSRSALSARAEASSVPFPASGTEMSATRPSSLDLTVIGSAIRPVATASLRRRAIPPRTSGAATFAASIATTAGSGPPGKAAWMRS